MYEIPKISKNDIRNYPPEYDEGHPEDDEDELFGDTELPDDEDEDDEGEVSDSVEGDDSDDDEEF